MRKWVIPIFVLLACSLPATDHWESAMATVIGPFSGYGNMSAAGGNLRAEKPMDTMAFEGYSGAFVFSWYSGRSKKLRFTSHSNYSSLVRKDHFSTYSANRQDQYSSSRVHFRSYSANRQTQYSSGRVHFGRYSTNRQTQFSSSRQHFTNYSTHRYTDSLAFVLKPHFSTYSTNRQIQFSNYTGSHKTTRFMVDSTPGNQTVDIAGYSNVLVCKLDATANTVTIADSTPIPIPGDPLSLQRECLQLVLDAGAWFIDKISTVYGDLIGVDSLTATPPLNITTPGVISIPLATNSVDGYLSAADRTAFNAKQTPGNYLTGLTDDVTASGPGLVSATVISGSTTTAGKVQLTDSTSSTSTTTAATPSSVKVAYDLAYGKQAALVSGTNLRTVGGVSLLGSGDVGTIGIGYGGTGSTTGSITGSGALTFAAGGSNQNVTLTPSGSGYTSLKTLYDAGISSPASTGVTPINSIARLSSNVGVVMDIGVQSVSPFGIWLQNSNLTDLSLHYPLLLNPNGGNVGIGTTNPYQKLDTTGIIQASNGDTLANPATALGNGARFSLNSGANTTNAYAIGLSAVRNSAYDMWFQTGSANGGGYRWYVGTTEKMTMDKDGNVGIGTTNPGAKLDVTGTLRSTAETTPTGGVGLESYYTSGIGYLLSYDRTNTLFKPLHINGSVLTLNADSGTPVLVGTNTDNGSDKLQVTGSVITSTQLKSSVATGTAPLVVLSTTPVANLSIGGNAGTATALAANGSNCSSTGGYAALGVNASGAAEGCWQVTPGVIGALDATAYIQGTTDTAFTVSATNLTVVGGTGVTYKRNYSQIGNIVFFQLEINPNGGTTASTVTSTYFVVNLPDSTQYVGCLTQNLSTDTGHVGCQVGEQRIWPPTWTATSGIIVISGSYLAI